MFCLLCRSKKRFAQDDDGQSSSGCDAPLQRRAHSTTRPKTEGSSSGEATDGPTADGSASAANDADTEVWQKNRISCFITYRVLLLIRRTS